MDELDNSQDLGPGARLRLMRESKGLSIATVAEQLHLREQVIIDLEKDDYSSMASVSFARGYIRAYAKFLQMPVDEALAAFDALCLQEKEDNARKFVRPKPSNTGVRAVRLTSIIVIAILVILIAWWWHHDDETAMPATMPTTSTTQTIKPTITISTDEGNNTNGKQSQSR